MPAAPERGAGAPAGDESFGKSRRVRRRAEYRAVQARGRRVHARSFVFLVLANEGLGRRLGVTVTRRACPRAVGRNRVKRVVREVFRRNRALFPDDADVVVVARRRAPTLGYPEVLAEVRGAASSLAEAAAKSRALDPGDRPDSPSPPRGGP